MKSLIPKTKYPKIASWPGFLASARGSGKDYKDFLPLARITRTKVVLARKYEEEGSGSTPEALLPPGLCLGNPPNSPSPLFQVNCGSNSPSVRTLHHRSESLCGRRLVELK